MQSLTIKNNKKATKTVTSVLTAEVIKINTQTFTQRATNMQN
jgi:hypothetical protein